MRSIIVLLVVGFVAQLIDGSLGMAYGATSTTLLLTAGLAPATASASVHLAEIGTTLMAGASHASFGNVHWPTVRRIALPGAVGAFVGAVLLSNISTEAARPWMAGILLALGLFIFVRFATGSAPIVVNGEPLKARALAPLGLVAGFVDATGGGGWGPIATPTLLVSGRMEPRNVIGSVDTSEFVVALAASAGFLLSLGSQGINFAYVAALLGSGLVAAPLAAWLVRKVTPRVLGSGVGGLLVITNVRTLFGQFDVTGPVSTVAYAALFALWGVAVVAALRSSDRLVRSAA